MLELFIPSRDAITKINMRSKRDAKLRNMKVGDTREMTSHPSAIRMAILKVCAVEGNYDAEFLIERASDYSAARPRHRITRTA